MRRQLPTEIKRFAPPLFICSSHISVGNGDKISYNFWELPNQFELARVQSNTIIGYSPVLLDASCGMEKLVMTALTMNLSSITTLSLVTPPARSWTGQDSTMATKRQFSTTYPTETSYNIYFGLKFCPPLNSSDLCPTDPKLVGGNATSITAESYFDNFDFTLSADSPAVGSGHAISDLLTDFTGRVRSNPPSRGALEAGSTFAIVEAIYFSTGSATTTTTTSSSSSYSYASTTAAAAAGVTSSSISLRAGTAPPLPSSFPLSPLLVPLSSPLSPSLLFPPLSPLSPSLSSSVPSF
jgi:hypothetical protein